MVTVAVAFLASLALALASTPLVRAAAIRFGALDQALTSRKIHGKPVPRLGGLAIVFSFYVPLVALLIVQTGTGQLLWGDPRRALALGAGGLAIAALGAFDDLRGADARSKLTVQFLVAVAMWAAGFRVDAISTPFGALDLGLLGLPFTVLWIVGVTNALNLIDGLDGLATGIALAAAATIFWVSVNDGRLLVALVMACLAGSLLGFLRYNFNPASIFMGDSGSLFVGFVLASTALETRHRSTTAVALIVPIVALALPIGDTLLAMTRRMARGQPLFSSDRGHLHHRLMDRGLSHRSTVLALYAIALVLAGVAVALYGSDAGHAWPTASRSPPSPSCCSSPAGYVRLDQGRRLLADRRQNLAMRAAVRAAGERLRRADGVDAVWEIVRETAPHLQASGAALVLVTRKATVRRTEFSWGFGEPAPGMLRARFSLLGEREDDGQLELGFSDGRDTVDRDTEISVELLCEHVYASLERIAASGAANGEDGTRNRSALGVGH